jgi:HAD superfamily hydrolase (TIGR01549 family)
MTEPTRTATFDLWHTVLYLEPEEEDRYNRGQLELAVDALEGSPRSGEASVRPREAFQQAAREALTLSERGVSVNPSDQIRRAGSLCGHAPDVERYRLGLDRLVETSPFQLAPGTHDAFGEIVQSGIRIGVIANTVGESGRAMRRILDREGLSPFVTAWSWSDELPWTKPAPEIFGHCLGQIDGTASHAIHVGDAIWDIEGARGAGFRAAILYLGLARYGSFYGTVIMHRDPRTARPDHIVRHMSELPSLARQLLGDGSS